MKTKLSFGDLKRRFPAVFDSEFRPLKRGIALDIVREIGGGVTDKDVSRLLSIRINNTAYHTVVARGGSRYDLNGQPDGEVTLEERAHSEEWFAKCRAKKEAVKEAVGKRAALVKAIQASGLNIDAYAKRNGLERAKTQSEHDKGIAERRQRRVERVLMVERFEASGLSAVEFSHSEGLSLHKFERTLQKVASYRVDELTNTK